MSIIKAVHSFFANKEYEIQKKMNWETNYLDSLKSKEHYYPISQSLVKIYRQNGVDIEEKIFGLKPIVFKMYCGLTEEQIDVLESQFTEFYKGMKFPLWYRDFLKETNGLFAFNAFSLDGIQLDRGELIKYDIGSPYDLYVENLGRCKKLPKSFLVIGSYAETHSDICIDTANNNGTIYLFQNESNLKRKGSNPLCMWNSLETFLLDELCRLEKLWKRKRWTSMSFPLEGFLPLRNTK